MSELPGGYTLVERAGERLALRADCAAELERAGYGLGRDPELRPSSLAGRKPLLEFSVASGTLLVRRFTHGGLLRALTGERFADPDRPFEELRISNALARAGIATPELVAARARRAPIAGWRLEIVTCRVEGAVDLDSVLARASAARCSSRKLRVLLRASGSFVRALHEAGLRHADLTTKNMLVDEAALTRGQPQFWILDLDRARLELPLAEEHRRASLVRLLRFVSRRASAREGPLGRAQFARFLQGYEPRRSVRHALWRALALERVRAAPRHRVGWWLERVFGDASGSAR